MSINVKKAMQIIEKDFKKNISHINFEYELEDTSFRVSADITLQGFEQTLLFLIEGNEGGGAWFRVVFERYNDTPDLLDKINAFNEKEFFFKAFLREDGYFEISNNIIMFDVNTYKDYAEEFFSRFVDLGENELLLEITE